MKIICSSVVFFRNFHLAFKNVHQRGITCKLIDFNLTDKRNLIESCDIAVFGPHEMKEMFLHKQKGEIYSLKKYNIGKLVIFSPWEGGFNMSPKHDQDILQKKLEIPVSIISQNELDSRLNRFVYYIHSAWNNPSLAWWPSHNIVKFKNLAINENPKFLFNFILGVPRSHKIELYNKLIKKNLLDNKCIWVHTFGRRAKSDNSQVYNDSIDYKNLTIDEISTIPKKFYFSQKIPKNEQNQIDALNTLYCIINSQFSLVVESEMLTKTNRYTEKTLKPISAGQPFVLAGNYRTLSLLKKDGFKTFHPYINESYDKESDTSLRIDMILDEIQRLKSLSNEDWNTLNMNISHILEHNKKHLLRLRGKYLKTIREIVRDPII